MSAVLKEIAGFSRGTSFSGSPSSPTPSVRSTPTKEVASLSDSHIPTEEPEESIFWILYQPKLFIVCIYYLVGVLFYHYHEGWNIVDCVFYITVSGNISYYTYYYIITTHMLLVTTVGYGDFSPTNDCTYECVCNYLLLFVCHFDFHHAY